jgi:hypothetical protein
MFYKMHYLSILTHGAETMDLYKEICRQITGSTDETSLRHFNSDHIFTAYFSKYSF